jgi:phenylacetate-CoA ligase
VIVELARDRAADEALAEKIRARLRNVLVVQVAVELVPYGSLPRSEYKSKLVSH